MSRELAAHEKLLKLLPVRDHVCEDDDLPKSKKRPIIVLGQHYASVNKARLAHNISHQTMLVWLEDGRARYA